MNTLLRRWAVALGLMVSAASAAAFVQHPGDLTRHVDPFIGTDGTGHVTPAAMVPFGMVAPGPDNADRGWSYSSGYQYRAPRILGFSNTHISGAGIPELGDVLLMPAAGTRWTAQNNDFSVAPDKKTESARPGVYRVTLPGHGVRVELTATQRVAVHRYTFTKAGRVQVLVDLQHGLLFGDGPRVTQATLAVDVARGELTGTTHSKNWVEREASFVVRFDRPIERVTTLPAREGDKASRVVLDFDLGPGRVLHARVALSTVDVDGARGNLAVDEARSFDAVRAAADAQWQRLLSRIEIDADVRFKKVFYSALYRTLLHPSDIADADGRVRGPTGQVMAAPGGVYYSTLSLWDTFRGAHPLFTLLVPERVPGFIQTLLAHHRAQGYLPLWTAWGRETHTMIGNPALPVIADAVAKGFHRQGSGFDLNTALQAMVETSTRPRPHAPEWAQRDWSDYEQFGYIPLDRISNESVSKTLELGIGDDAVARVARVAGHPEVAERFARRAQGWRHLWDAQTQTMRGKDSTGRWREPFDPLTPTSPMNNPGDYTEANAWQYTLTPALHDPAGLVAQMGGPAAFEAWLDRFFSVRNLGDNNHLGQEAMIGQYAHGNEPSHHIAYLYAWTASPQKGHALIQRIVRDFYGPGPDGIIGNDDCGQMSAWLVLSTLGFYPVVPASGEYVAGTPQLRRAALRRSDGTRLEIRSGSRPGVWLDGRRMQATALPHPALLRARRLELGPAQWNSGDRVRATGADRARVQNRK
jgi:predicted alpha-1,2-mannosidase